jgi:hypothetical protein
MAQAFALAVAALVGGMAGIAAQSAGQPKLNAHQSYMEAVMRRNTLDVTDPLAVFAFVLDRMLDLHDRIVEVGGVIVGYADGRRGRSGRRSDETDAYGDDRRKDGCTHCRPPLLSRPHRTFGCRFRFLQTV